MFEDPDGRARQTSSQHQGRMIQFITQNETTLQNHKKNFHTFQRLISNCKIQILLFMIVLAQHARILQATVILLSNSLKTKLVLSAQERCFASCQVRQIIKHSVPLLKQYTNYDHHKYEGMQISASC